MDKHEWHKLVKQAMAGNREAFDEVYRAKARVILAHAGKLVYNQAAVGDAVQEVAVRMFGSIGKLRSPEAFNVWLYRIILNTCHTVNKQSAAHTYVSLEEIEETPEENGMEYLPADEAERRDRNHTIAKAIDSLPEKQRLTLVMYYFDEMSYKEIAQILNTTTDAVGVNIMKAKKSLKGKLAASAIEDGSSTRVAIYGAALVPAIQQALRLDMARMAPQKPAEAMAEKNLAAVRGGMPPAKSGAGEALAKGLKYLAVSAAVFAIAGAILFGGLAYGQKAEASPFSAEIVMNGRVPGEGEHVNPADISLHILEGTAEVLAWHIENSEGQSQCTGTAGMIGTELAALPPGGYKASWLVETPDGQRVWVRREFEIR